MNLRRLLPPRLLRALRRVRLVWARRRGAAVSSPREDVHRPPLRAGRPRLRLSHALVACDTNPAYLAHWPNTARAWREVVGIEPVLVLVAQDDEVPDDLRDDDHVIRFEPLAGVHTTLQAQCIRLLYPALLETRGAVVVSDIDLYPLRASYFHLPIAPLDARFFVTYRDIRLHQHEINIAYNAATPATWSDVFGVHDLDGVRSRLLDWAKDVEYHGGRGWPGWFTDQERLYEALHTWPEAAERFWTLDDDYTRFRRLERDALANGLPRRLRLAVRHGRYSDFSCLLPYAEHREVNDAVLQAALDS